mmetsp:Transcript_5829/g.19808  ORF Transcript_5829/g.19808 Transcript_5829/m.19808 type:complete len:269 (+) Transcript_5829:4310-5116(+)
MRGVASELAQWHELGAHGGGEARALGALQQPHPVAVARAPRRNIVSKDVVGVCDPESGGGGVGVEHVMGLARQDPQVAFDHIVPLVAVLEEKCVPHDVIGHIVGHVDVVGGVHGHCAVEGMMDGAAADVRPQPPGACHVVVDTVATQSERLPRPPHLDILETHIPPWAEGRGKDLNTIAPSGGFLIALNDDIPGDDSDLGAHIERGSLNVRHYAKVRELQRPAEEEAGAAAAGRFHPRDRHLVDLIREEGGGGHHHGVPHAPVHGALK